MKALSIFFGIILAIFGISMMCTPLLTYLSVGTYLAILILTHGVIGVINAIISNKYGLNLVYAVLSFLAGLLILTVPGILGFMELMGGFVMAAWIIIQGALGIVGCVTAKRNGRKLWWLILIFGITTLLLGLYAFVHPLFSAAMSGFMVGLFFLQSGINMFFAEENIQ